jgi:molybdopterin converting factor small subunit
VPGVHVTVRLSGSLAERLGARVALELEPGATVQDALDALGLERELGERAADALAVVAAGTIVPHRHALADGDALDVLVPVAGG